jgi:hypothetical protein
MIHGYVEAPLRPGVEQPVETVFLHESNITK